MADRLHLVDTSFWILVLRKEPSLKADKRIDSLLEAGLVATTPPVRMELLAGTKTESEYERLAERLGALTRLSVDAAVWDKAARLGFDLRRKGVTVPHIDLVIAAVAIQAEAVLVHADGDFDLVARHTNLHVESFAKSCA